MQDAALKLIAIFLNELNATVKNAVADAIAQQDTSIKSECTESDFLTRAEVSKMLHVSFTTLFHWNNNGTLPNHKIGKKVFYSKSLVLDKLNHKSE